MTGHDQFTERPAGEPEPADPPDHREAAAESTGNPRVDAGLARLADLERRPVHEHAAVVEEVHRALQDTLAEEED
ncbi:MAG: hypothetical protein ACRDWI_18155 [Jiangellaceae bacterium]